LAKVNPDFQGFFGILEDHRIRGTDMAGGTDKREAESSAQLEAESNMSEIPAIVHRIHDQLRELMRLDKTVGSQIESLDASTRETLRLKHISTTSAVSRKLREIAEDMERIRLEFASRELNRLVINNLYDYDNIKYYYLPYSSTPSGIDHRHLGDFATDITDYDKFRIIVRYFNNFMRRWDAAIAHPETGEPCTLYALPSKDGTGRLTLENRVTKKRSGFYKSLKEICPIRLVPDVPRKEDRIERRESKSESE
jgi:hypothetical protein